MWNKAGARFRRNDFGGAARVTTPAVQETTEASPAGVTAAVAALAVGFLVVSPTVRCFRKSQGASPTPAYER